MRIFLCSWFLTSNHLPCNWEQCTKGRFENSVQRGVIGNSVQRDVSKTVYKGAFRKQCTKGRFKNSVQRGRFGNSVQSGVSKAVYKWGVSKTVYKGAFRKQFTKGFFENSVQKGISKTVYCLTRSRSLRNFTESKRICQSFLIFTPKSFNLSKSCILKWQKLIITRKTPGFKYLLLSCKKIPQVI